MRNQCHPKYLRSKRTNLIETLCHFHAAAFAATAGMNLRLHNPHTAADLLRSRNSFIDSKRRLSLRSRDAEFFENVFALVFMNFHCVSR